MMSAYECYKEYVALKLHFSNLSYDYFKYNGKTKVLKPASFETNKDKLFYMKLAKHEDPKNVIVANLLENNKLWIRDIAYKEEAYKTYNQWLKRQQSLMYMFTQELNKLDEEFDSNFKIENHSQPNVMKLYLRKEISLETLVMLVDSVRCISYWSKKLEYDPVAEEVLVKIQKYRPFLNYDKEKAKNILLDKFSNAG
jgi:hypothetical protein